MKNSHKPTTILGEDENGAFLICKPRPKLTGGAVLIFFLLFLALFSNGQTVTTTDGKTYTAVHKAKTSAPEVKTDKVFLTEKGEKFPIYQSEGGSFYIIRVSKKSGKEYRQYLKL